MGNKAGQLKEVTTVRRTLGVTERPNAVTEAVVAISTSCHSDDDHILRV